MPSRYHPASPFIIRLFLNLIYGENCVFLFSIQVLSVLSSYVSNQKDTLHYFLWPFKMLANTESWSKWPRSHGWEMTGPYSESTSHLCPGMGQDKAGRAKPNIWLLADTHGLSCCQVAEDLWMASKVKVTLRVEDSTAEEFLHHQCRRTNTHHCRRTNGHHSPACDHSWSFP